MKKLFYSLAFIIVTSFAISACSEEPITPADGNSNDKCQFGGPGCPTN